MGLTDFTGESASRTAADGAAPRALRLRFSPSTAFQKMPVSAYRAHLSEVMNRGSMVEVTNHGSTAGYWIPAEQMDDGSDSVASTDAYFRLSLAIATLASAIDPTDTAEQLADLEALRDAEGAIE